MNEKDPIQMEGIVMTITKAPLSLTLSPGLSREQISISGPLTTGC